MHNKNNIHIKYTLAELLLLMSGKIIHRLYIPDFYESLVHPYACKVRDLSTYRKTFSMNVFRMVLKQIYPKNRQEKYIEIAVQINKSSQLACLLFTFLVIRFEAALSHHIALFVFDSCIRWYFQNRAWQRSMHSTNLRFQLCLWLLFIARKEKNVLR